MRLRKNMKRAAAAALALSVALSAAAPAALAKDYYIDDGNITVTVTEDGDTYVRVGDAKDDKDIGEKDDTDVVIKGGKNPDKQTENKSDGSADKDTADEAEKQKPVVDAEPGEPAEETGTELVVWPENAESGEAQKKDGPADAEPKTPDTPDTQKPEGKTDAATLEASTEQKPVEKAAEDEDDDKDIMTYENNTADTVTKAVNDAVQHIITIINNYTKKDTTVTIKDVNIDVSKDGKAAMAVQGKGDTTVKLKGDNTLKSGNSHAGVEKNDSTSNGKLTITADSTQDSLVASGGSNAAGIGSSGGKQGTSKLAIEGGTITATGGLYGAGIGGGWSGKAEVTITGNAVIKKAQGNYNGAGIGGGGAKGTVTISGNAVIENAIGGMCERGGAGIGGGGWNVGDVTISENAKVNAEGGCASAGIGGGFAAKGIVKILGNAQVTAKGGKQSGLFKAGAAIGSGALYKGAGGDQNLTEGEELELDFSEMTGGSVTRIDGKTESEHIHDWQETNRVAATQDSAGEVEYFCKGCGSTSVKILPVMQPEAEENSSDTVVVLTITGAPTYEMHQESVRYIVTADSDTATLFGCLGNLAELKAQGVDTLVFRTKSRETALDIDTMLSLGTEDTIFTLTHSGSSATLTVGGADHNELIH